MVWMEKYEGEAIWCLIKTYLTTITVLKLLTEQI